QLSLQYFFPETSTAVSVQRQPDFSQCICCLQTSLRSNCPATATSGTSSPAGTVSAISGGRAMGPVHDREGEFNGERSEA
ncbi:MAG TPA: hypothetical protein VN032_09295, partial [Thermoanaerobaculia bacterium]|nr:hypothetical protein [Thermoanaerobaculia bacterium]